MLAELNKGEMLGDICLSCTISMKRQLALADEFHSIVSNADDYIPEFKQQELFMEDLSDTDEIKLDEMQHLIKDIEHQQILPSNIKTERKKRNLKDNLQQKLDI